MVSDVQNTYYLPTITCKISHICRVSQSSWNDFKSSILFDPFNNPGKSENRDEESESREDNMEAFCGYETRGKSQKSTHSGRILSLVLFEVY